MQRKWRDREIDRDGIKNNSKNFMYYILSYQFVLYVVLWPIASDIHLKIVKKKLQSLDYLEFFGETKNIAISLVLSIFFVPIYAFHSFVFFEFPTLFRSLNIVKTNIKTSKHSDKNGEKNSNWVKLNVNRSKKKCVQQ